MSVTEIERDLDLGERLDELLARLDRLETTLSALVQQRMVKEWYTTAELATILDRAEFTVREWCRLSGRVGRQPEASLARGQEIALQSTWLHIPREA